MFARPAFFRKFAVYSKKFYDLMTPINKKINVGVTLLTLFIITLATGIILHLKKHGIVVEPRSVIKVIHWVAGFLMVALTCLHATQFWKMFVNLRSRVKWFNIVTWAVIILTAAVFLTGTVKLLTPVKIPHLGLWHFALGIAMSVGIALHLIRGIPALGRLCKAAKK